MKVLLVTLAIGEAYLKQYELLFKQSQENYAKRYKYDFKVITDFLDKDKNNQLKSTITFNKILVCSQEWSKDYDLIIFVDADILISVWAPPLHNYMDYENLIGMVDEFSQPTKAKRLELHKRQKWEANAVEFYKLCDLDIETDMVFNTGVMVMQPKIHADFLEGIYKKYIEKSKTHKRGYIFEETCISYEMQKNNLYKILPNKFNALWALIAWDNIDNILLEDFFRDNYFTHFAGQAELAKVPALHKQYNTLF